MWASGARWDNKASDAWLCVSCTCVVSQGCAAAACPSAVCGRPWSSEASVSVLSEEPLSVQAGCAGITGASLERRLLEVAVVSRRFVVVVLADAGSLLPTSVFTGLQERPQMSCASVCPVTLPETNAFGLINVYFCMHLMFVFDCNPAEVHEPVEMSLSESLVSLMGS